MSLSARNASVSKKQIIWLCATIALFTAIVPFARSFFRVEVDYNEGWNIYNATTLSQHHLLYPTAYAWTSVNYPMLSFWVLAQLHRFTHDYLYTARVLSLLSLIACSILVAAIVRSLDASRRAATLAGLLCFALFCSQADQYIGMDDPQMFAQVFYLLSLYIYLRDRRSFFHIAAAAFILVIAGSIKHNLLEFPLVVLVDIVLLSRRPVILRTLCFSFVGIFAVAGSILLSVRFGGPAFLDELLAPRGYSVAHLFDQLLLFVGPILPALALAAYTAWSLRNDPIRRIASVLFITAAVLATAFSGGSGVASNAFFGALLAAAILLGLLFSRLETAIDDAGAPSNLSVLVPYIPVALFLSLGIPLILTGNWNPIAALHEITTSQSRFDQDIAFLRSHQGPALCESLLECDFAYKPYIYDPFNATRLIRMHKLDGNILIGKIQRREFSVIQTNDPLPREDEYDGERWDPQVRAAIEANYTPALRRSEIQKGTLWIGEFYTPRLP